MKIIKKLCAMTLALILTTSIASTAVAASNVPTTVDKSQMTAKAISAVGEVYVNGSILSGNDNMGYFWVDANGRTQAPVRLLVEKMGYTISYDKGVVTVPGGPNGDLKVTIGKNNYTVGGSEKTMDTVAAMIDGRTYVPLRFVAEALGAKVDAKGTANGLIIKITFDADTNRTINGVLDISTTQLTKTNAVLDELDKPGVAGVFRETKGVIEFNTQKETTGAGLELVIRRGDGWKIEGLSFGQGSESQYKVVFALIDDVVEETSRQQIKDMLQEFNKTLSSGYDPDVGVTQTAIDWQKDKENTTTRVGNVNFTWGKYCNNFSISTASN